MKSLSKSSVLWLAAFTGIFSVLSAYVFWGTWSPDVAPVMPDDATVHSLVYADYWDGVVRNFIANGQILPSDLLWKGLLVSPYFCQELKYAAALFSSALALAFFLRGRGLSHLASYGAGLLLAFCGYWSSLFSAGHAGWFYVITYIVFLFGFSDRAVRANALQHWLLLGLFAGWSLMCQPDFCFIMALLAALYFAWCCVRERKFPWKGMLIAGTVFLLVGGLGFRSALASKQTREEQIARGETVAEKGGEKMDDAVKRWIFVTNWSLPPEETAEFFIPRLNGDTSCPLTLSIGMSRGTGIRPYTGALGRPLDAPKGNYRQHSLYVGWVTCLLALAGVVFALSSLMKGQRSKVKGQTGQRSKVKGQTEEVNHHCLTSDLEPLTSEQTSYSSSDIAFFLGTALFFYLFSLGRNFEPLYRLVFSLPVGDSLRGPVKWHHLTEFSLVVLAGYGIHYAEQFLRSRPRPLRFLVPLALFVLLGAFDLARVDHLYCAPVTLRQVRKTNSDMQMNVLRRQDFSNPQLAELVKRGRVVSLANYLGNPDLFLVEMLTPRPPPGPRAPLPPVTLVTALGCLSVLTALAVVVYALLLPLLRARRSPGGA